MRSRKPAAAAYKTENQYQIPAHSAVKPPAASSSYPELQPAGLGALPSARRVRTVR